MKQDSEFRLDDYLLPTGKQLGDVSSLGAYAPTPAPRCQVMGYARFNVVSTRSASPTYRQTY